MTDNDCNLFSVNCQNFFDKYKKFPLFHFSNFNKTIVVYSDENRKTFPFFKVENPSDFIKIS